MPTTAPPPSRPCWSPQFGDPLKLATGEAVIAVSNDDGAQPMLAAMGEADGRRRLAASLVADARALM